MVLVSDWSMSVATSQVSPLFKTRTNHETSHFCLSEGKPRRERDCRKMLFFIPFIAYAALFEIVTGANETSGQRSCTVDTEGKGIVKFIMFALKI